MLNYTRSINNHAFTCLFECKEASRSTIEQTLLRSFAENRVTNFSYVHKINMIGVCVWPSQKGMSLLLSVPQGQGKDEYLLQAFPNPLTLGST